MKNGFCLTIAFLSILCRTTLAQSPVLTRGPYLQVLTPTSVVIRWRTDQPTLGRVWYGLSANQLTNSFSEVQPTSEHVLTLTGLQPNTRYAYAIGYGDTKQAAGADYYVKTALPAGDRSPFRMWVLGDFGSGNDNQARVYQAYLNATTTRPADLWLWLGDNAYSYGLDEEYQRLVFPVYAATLRNTPLFITPGNHDYGDSQTNVNIAYYKQFSFPQQGESGGVPSGSKAYYSANYGNVHLISLDSQGQDASQRRLYDTTGTQVQWLKRDLEANQKSGQTWTLVIFHHPPYSKGSHDSDTEESMRLLRENLTPILERYGVDLVMNGHSHGYERTYRIKGLRGLANTFDRNINVAENTTARYDGSSNSCPILTKGEGTVYIVNGSGGQLGGQSAGFPHPATVYNNVSIGGSMLLDVNDNRLDAQFLLADGTVQDKFTLMRNVNKTTALTAEYADTLQLAASWPGDYQWPNGQASRTIRYVADKAGNYPVIVTDKQQCLTDQFTLTVQQPPKLTAKLGSAAAVCAGSALALTALPENTTKAAGWQYDILLSDASGNFTTERVIGTGSLTALTGTIPASVPPGAGYRLQVRPRGISYTQLVPSETFTIQSLPTATISGSTTALPGQPVSLTLNLTGNGPWNGTLSDGTEFSSSATPTVLTVQPTKSVSYSINSVTNSCGQGSVSGQAIVTVLLPTGEEPFADGQLRIYPNPVHDVVQVALSIPRKQDVQIRLTDQQGRTAFQKPYGGIQSLNETIPMPPVTGIYLLTIQVGEQTLTRKVIRQ